MESGYSFQECALDIGRGCGQHFNLHPENRTQEEVPTDRVSPCDPAFRGHPREVLVSNLGRN